jgi:fermentation-respiration switch protein FrsA (DUF1100 family)
VLAEEFAKGGGAGKGAPAEAALEEQVRRAVRPHVRFLLTYDPRPVLTRVRCPVLALNGGSDVQVPPRPNLRAIRAALREGGNEDFTVEELPKLNHLLQTCASGAMSEYGKIEETMAPAALERIGDWVVQRARAR